MTKNFDYEDHEKFKQEKRTKFIEKDGQERNAEVMEVRKERNQYVACEKAIVEAVREYKEGYNKRMKLMEKPGE